MGENKKGKLYGLGIGPGDPELLTLKALRLVKECGVIAVPGKVAEETVAYRIVEGAYPALKEKKVIAVEMPMTKDQALLQQSHDRAAEQVEEYLRQGTDVAFLTLGDTTVYSTYLYVHKRVLRDGFHAEIVSGVTSFCAVAARLNMGLVEKDQALHVIPATFHASAMDEILSLPGTKVLMKSGKQMEAVKESILRSGQDAVMIENCGMPGEKIYMCAEEIPEDAGYYSLIIVKEKEGQA